MGVLLDTLKWSVIIGVLALGLALLRPVFEKRYRARWRYWVWLFLAVLALLAPVQWEKLAPAAPAVRTAVVIDVPEIELQVIRGDRVSVALRPVTGLPPAAAGPSGTARSWRMAEALPLIWLGGAAVFMLYHLAGTMVFRRRVLRWSRSPSEEALDIFDKVWQDMELEKTPYLCVSSAVGSPMLLGVLRPCLVLPSERWERWELAFILRHELTHYRRRDLWYKLVLLAANALHWFNPLMYLLVREAGADLELTCDDAVVEGLGRDARRAYSETLLTAIHQEKCSALSTHFYGGKEAMKERFRNILTRRRRKRGVLILVLTLLIAGASACAFGLRQTEEPAQEPDGGSGPEQTDDAGNPVVTPPVSTLGNTESFLYEGLELTVTNVREIRQGSQQTDLGKALPYTIFVCYPGAQASILNADMDDGVYANWAFDYGEDGYTDITDNIGPITVTEDTLGVYSKEASVYVLRFEIYGRQELPQPVQPAQGEEPEIVEPSANVSASDLYRAVLLGEAVFHDVGGTIQQDLTIDNIKQVITSDETLSASIPLFTVVDLDGDGEAEVVLMLRIKSIYSDSDSYNDVGSAVLHRIGSEVYSYTLFLRQFNDLKTDGTFSWSGGASNNGYGTLTFSETGYTMNEVETLGDTYVTWYDFTPENIERILGGI